MLGGLPARTIDRNSEIAREAVLRLRRAIFLDRRERQNIGGCVLAAKPLVQAPQLGVAGDQARDRSPTRDAPDYFVQKTSQLRAAHFAGGVKQQRNVVRRHDGPPPAAVFDGVTGGAAGSGTASWSG